jgi:hypothetical protein
MMIMREIWRGDLSGVANQIWKVTTDLIPRIVSRIRSSSEGVPPKDTGTVVEATKMPQPRNFPDDEELPDDLDVPVDLGLETVGTTGSDPWANFNDFQVDDLVLVKRANRSDGPT